MGKTKTAFIGGTPDDEKTGKEAYEERRKKKEAAAARALESEGKKTKVKGLGLKGGERVKVIGGEPEIAVEEEKAKEIPEAQGISPKHPKPPKSRGKKYQKARMKIDRNKTYPISEAIKLVKETSYSKFAGTMELHFTTKKVGLSANITLPHWEGKAKKIEIASDETIDKLKKGKIDFDMLLATAEMMPKLVPFARVLGPKGLMPNPKNGTLIKDKKEAAKFSGNSFNLKTEKEAPVIHTVIGKTSQSDKDLEENIQTIFDAVSTKQILKAYLKSTMSPSVKLAIS